MLYYVINIVFFKCNSYLDMINMSMYICLKLISFRKNIFININ